EAAEHSADCAGGKLEQVAGDVGLERSLFVDRVALDRSEQEIALLLREIACQEVRIEPVDVHARRTAIARQRPRADRRAELLVGNGIRPDDRGLIAAI